MPNWLRRFDDGLARGEAVLAVTLLFSMVFVAAAQAALRNLARMGLSWANVGLQHMEFADPFLQKGTLWLAFLGASLATHSDRHIAIDVIPRLLPRRARALVQLVVRLASAVAAFYLARIFWWAVANMATDRPLEYEVLTDAGPMHVCDASAQALAQAEAHRPAIFCAVRNALATLGAPAETPGAAAQYIAPVGLLGARAESRGDPIRRARRGLPASG